MEIKKPLAKKRVRIYAEDDMLIVCYKTSDYINNKAFKNNNNKSIDIASNHSTQDLERFLVLA